MILFIVLIGLLIMISVFLSSFRLFNYLVMFEMFKLLLLVRCIILGVGKLRVVFMSLMALFVLEVSVVLGSLGSVLCGNSYEVVVGL